MKSHFFLVLVFVALNSWNAKAQTAPAATDSSPITQAFVRSQSLKQGDMESLKKAEAEFTPQGLIDFIKKMDGFLDDKGAPTFSQEFVPTGDAVTIGQQNDLVIVHVSGELKQTHNAATTTYPGTFKVSVAGTPPKIVQFSLMIGTSK